jgi:hypothetical protein
VAAKLILVDVWHAPIGLTLAVIAGALATAALTSVLADRRERRRGERRPHAAGPHATARPAAAEAD